MNENIKSHNYLKEKNVLNKNTSNLVNDDILKFNTNIKKNNNVERFYHDQIGDSNTMYNKNGHHINKSVGGEINISGNKSTNLVNIKNNNQRFFSKSENENYVIRNPNMREDNYTTNIIKGKDNDTVNNRKNANINNNEYLYFKNSDDKFIKNMHTSGYADQNILRDNNKWNGNRNDIEKDNNITNNEYYSYNCKTMKKVKEPNNSLDSFYKRKREMEEETYEKKRVNHSLNNDYYYNTYKKSDINDSRMNIKYMHIKDMPEDISKIKNLQNDIMNVKNMEKTQSRVHNISESEKSLYSIINQSSNNSTKTHNPHSYNTNENCNYYYKKVNNSENSYLEADENVIPRSCKIEEEKINNNDNFVRRNFMYDNKLIDTNKNHQYYEDKSEEQYGTRTILNKEDNINHENRKLLYNNVKDGSEIESNDGVLNDLKIDVSKAIDTKNTISLSQEESNIIYKDNNDNDDAKKDNWEHDLSSNNGKNQSDGLKKIGVSNDIMNTYKHKLVDNTNHVLNKGQNKNDEDGENLLNKKGSEGKNNLIKKNKYNESISKRLFSTHTLSSNNKCVSSANYLKNNIKTGIKNSFKETNKKGNLDCHKISGFSRVNTNLDKINSKISRNNGITKNSIQKNSSSNMHTNLSNIQAKKKTIDNTVNNNYKHSANENKELEDDNEKVKKKQKIEYNKTYNNSFLERMKKKNPNENVDGNKNTFIQKTFQNRNNLNFEKSKTKMFLPNNKNVSKNGLQEENSINSKVGEKKEVPLYKRNVGSDVVRENVTGIKESNIDSNSKSNTINSNNMAKTNILNRERVNNNKDIRTVPSSNSTQKSTKNTLLVKRQTNNNHMNYGSKAKEVEDNKLKMKSLVNNKYVSKWNSNKTSSSSNVTNNVMDKKNNMVVKKDEVNKKKREMFNQVAKINTNINPVIENKQINPQTKNQYNKIINKDQNSSKNSNSYNNKKCTPNNNMNQNPNNTRKPNENNANRTCNKKKNNNNSNNNKDIISKEMEKYKYLMKKNKIKSNSIPPGNQKEVEKNANKYDCRNNYRSRDDYGCDNKYGRLSKNGQFHYDNMLFLKDKKGHCESDSEYPYTVQEAQNQSCYINNNTNNNDSKHDGSLEYLKDKDEKGSKNINTSNSLNNGEEQKELSYFEWLAKEQERKENEMDKKKKVNKQENLHFEQTESERNDAANYDKMGDNENEEAYEEEDSEDDEESDTNAMLQPLLAFNLKQNERSYEQNDFVVDKHPIGNGRTGLVFKAIIRKENLQVALKVMAKDTILSLKIERQVLKEIIIQSSLKHINILDLIAYFEDKTRLFLVLEIANGGSIRNKMKLKHDTFKEEQVALYVYQIADALSYLHNFNIIHRDLKPDNILIHYSDSDVYSDEHASKIYKYGIIKIADFGFSCQLKNKRQKRSTFCGTVDYMPPEIINQIPYDCNADLWCLGIVIFELLVGFPPFTDNSQERVFEQIKEFDFHFPKTVSQMARELILRLCSRSSEERISAEEVKSHPWITQFL
ncbi:serine/threonine protein kinase, putative [Plasmodium chabaudi adami]|uniref:Aurora kinase n=1 Tax=Plasmodium chabaudi adami TaxID=5826 RepID=A0A1C6XCY0_PLACE|nr:serine/threonine protein kinase, putative [Plasmodium chabaudi adami]